MLLFAVSLIWSIDVVYAGWRNTDVITLLGMKDEFSHIPYRFDTDVNAPALAEYHLRNFSSSTSSAYITVGTGVGVGLVINGKTVHGLLHPEAGHVQGQPILQNIIYLHYPLYTFEN